MKLKGLGDYRGQQYECGTLSQLEVKHENNVTLSHECFQNDFTFIVLIRLVQEQNAHFVSHVMKFETFSCLFVLYEDATFQIYVWTAILNGSVNTVRP